MLFIGICGASGSGKSTLANRLQELLEKPAIVLAQDSYYLDHSHLSMDERRLVNYDEPAAFDHDALYFDLLSLKEGHPITRKQYDYTYHCRADSEELIYPTDVVILEGIHAFYDERLRELMDLKLYIKVDPDICILRRVERDIIKRGRGITDIIAQYKATVKPMYDKYIKNYDRFADIIVTGGGRNALINDLISSYINRGNKKTAEEKDV